MHHCWKADFHFYYSLLLCCCSNSCKIVRLHCSCGRIGRSNQHHYHAFSRNRSCGGTHYAKYGLCCLSSTVDQRCQFQYRNYSYFPNYDAYDPLYSPKWSCWISAESSISYHSMTFGSAQQRSKNFTGHLLICCFIVRTLLSLHPKNELQPSAKYSPSLISAYYLQVAATRCIQAYSWPFHSAKYYYIARDSFP